MKWKIFTIVKYLVVFSIIIFSMFLILKYLFKIDDLQFIGVVGIGAVIVGLSAALTKSKRQKKMYDKHMESFYFQERKRNF